MCCHSMTLLATAKHARMSLRPGPEGSRWPSAVEQGHASSYAAMRGRHTCGLASTVFHKSENLANGKRHRGTTTFSVPYHPLNMGEPQPALHPPPTGSIPIGHTPLASHPRSLQMPSSARRAAGRLWQPGRDQDHALRRLFTASAGCCSTVHAGTEDNPSSRSESSRKCALSDWLGRLGSPAAPTAMARKKEPTTCTCDVGVPAGTAGLLADSARPQLEKEMS